jgi:prepilin-type N-terminal cleavage/methylation domain-containing protein
VIKKQEGFSLTELMITMAVFVVFIAAASGVFTGLLTQFKQQSKLAETSIEGMIGLEILREDVEQAGYGLPQTLTGVADADGDGNFWEHLGGIYQEAVSAATTPDPATFNDSTRDIDGDGNVGEEPRAILSGDNSGFNGSDYLVVKALNVARNFTAGKWQYLYSDGSKEPWIPQWEEVDRDNNNDQYSTVRVIVISPGSTESNAMSLIVSGGTYSSIDVSGLPSSGFWPATGSPPNVMYGVDPDTSLRMPFNRADYYISNSNVPSRCAPNTGVLVKATINHGDGKRNAMPLLDCVADFQVDYWLDTDGDGDIDWAPSDDISSLTAKQIRDQLREVRVYIVAQDGQRDMNYDFSKNNTRQYLSAQEFLDTYSHTVNFVNLKTQIGDPEYKYYHWKLYTVIANPTNLR